jgi:hypothetical protein
MYNIFDLAANFLEGLYAVRQDLVLPLFFRHCWTRLPRLEAKIVNHLPGIAG